MKINCPICGSTKTAKIKEGVRDDDNIDVLRCSECQHAYLSTFSHIKDDFYREGGIQENRIFGSAIDQRLKHYHQENIERLNRFKPLLTGRRVLDFGCGAGGFVELAKPFAARIDGVEPNDDFRNKLEENGFRIFADIGEVPEDYDVITSFHVIEHVADPRGMMTALLSRLRPSGHLIIEVPNHDDALLSIYRSEAYRSFYYLRNHLHYFSLPSLTNLAKACAAENGEYDWRIQMHSRFSLANHLHWLAEGKPEGHREWFFLDTPELTAAYKESLYAIGKGDSLVLIAKRTAG